MSWDRTWGKTAMLIKAALDREAQPVRVSATKPSSGVALGA
jgi:hypothetical protein